MLKVDRTKIKTDTMPNGDHRIAMTLTDGTTIFSAHAPVHLFNPGPGLIEVAADLVDEALALPPTPPAT